jgi:uncharacterized RDD family membrane protein YckC
VIDPETPPSTEPAFDSPSGVWFAMESGRQSGPWSVGALRDRLTVTLITPESPVWTDGMPAWLPYAEVFAPDGSLKVSLAPVGAVAPPGEESEVARPAFDPNLPGTPPTADADGPRSRAAHPWRRWFARILDLWCTAFLQAILVAILGYDLEGGRVVETLVLLAMQVPLETAYQTMAGTTPGKWLLGIRVREVDGRRLSWSRAFSRALHVWLIGMGGGIPIVSLVTMGRQHALLNRDGITSYDAEAGFVVTHGPVSQRRKALVVVIVVIMSTLIAIGTSKSM